jgi:hypothetical protein
MFDLDAAKAARREALGDAPEVQFGGVVYALPVEMSYSAAMALQRNDLDAGLVHLLGADAYDSFMESEPSMEDIVDLIEWIGKEYEERNSDKSEDTDGKSKGKGRGKAKASTN